MGHTGWGYTPGSVPVVGDSAFSGTRLPHGRGWETDRLFSQHRSGRMAFRARAGPSATRRSGRRAPGASPCSPRQVIGVSPRGSPPFCASAGMVHCAAAALGSSPSGRCSAAWCWPSGRGVDGVGVGGAPLGPRRCGGPRPAATKRRRRTRIRNSVIMGSSPWMSNTAPAAPAAHLGPCRSALARTGGMQVPRAVPVGRQRPPGASVATGCASTSVRDRSPGTGNRNGPDRRADRRVGGESGRRGAVCGRGTFLPIRPEGATLTLVTQHRGGHRHQHTLLPAVVPLLGSQRHGHRSVRRTGPGPRRSIRPRGIDVK